MKHRRFFCRASVLLCALGFTVSGFAAIPLGVLQTFTTQPTNTSWSTLGVPGTGTSITSAVEIEESIQTNDVALITNSLLVSSSPVPNTSAVGATWSSSGGFLQTRPAGVACMLLLAMVENTSGANLSFLDVRYRFSMPALLFGEEPGLAGHHVFYSLSGLPYTWMPVPNLTTESVPPTDGSLCATLALGSWPAGSLLYILWADDNGFPSIDGSFAIDDFIATPAIADVCPPFNPVLQPQNVTNLQGRTVQLKINAVGVNLAYQWHNVLLGPISLVDNPTANRSTLVITNARISDTGDYFAVVSSPAGSVTSRVAHVEILHDDIPPRILSARQVLDYSNGLAITTFQLTFDEALCADSMSCGGDATEVFNWWLEDLTDPDGEPPWLVVGSLVGGTNLILYMDFGVRSPKAYRLTYVGNASGITDINGQPLATGAFVEVPTTLFIQPGTSNYVSVEDTELEQGGANGGPSVPHGSQSSILVDFSNANGQSHGLLQFKNLFGIGAGQVPPGSTILSARLRLTSTGDSGGGHPVQLHRMLRDWSEATAVFGNSGVQLGADADLNVVATLNTITLPVPFTVEADVTSSVRAWAAGAANHGWALLPTGTDGFSFDSSETANGPKLVIEYQAVIDRCDTAFVTQPPPGLTVLEGGSFTLAPTANVIGFAAFQWMKDDIDLPGATNLSITITNALLCRDAGRYQLRVTCFDGSVTSATTVVSFLVDIVSPNLVSAIGDLAGTNITLRFSKPMSTNTAVNVASYILDPELPVLHAALSADGYAVTLTTAPRGLEEYTLRIQGVTDSRGCNGGNLLQPNPTLIALTGVQQILPWASVWQYATNSQDATFGGTPWFSPSFTPGADWRSGVALFGHESSVATVAQFPAPIATFIPPNTNTPPDFITTYYRREIELPSIPSNASYVLSHFIDDGAVFYLDGVEMGRFNLSSGSPVLSTVNAIAAGEASFQHLAFAATPGPHLLAVEVHQAGPAANSDILFGAQIIAITPLPTLTILNPPRPLLLWYTDSAWELTTSTNIAGPYFTAPSYSVPRVFSTLPTNVARFYQLRFRGGFK